MPDQGSLRSRAVSGMRWTGSSAVVIAVVQFLQVTILANLLSPTDFGLMASVLVIAGLAQVLGDGGMSTAIMVRRIKDPQVLSTLYWSNIGLGVVIAVVLIACAPLASAFFGTDELNGLIPLAAIGFVLTPVGAQFRALLHTELRFETLARVDVASAVAGAVVAIVAAVLGAGAYALAAAYVATAAVGAAQLVVLGWRRWRPRWHWRRSELASILDLSFFQTGNQALNYLTLNLDYIVIGSALGPAALGIYVLAWQLIIAPVMRLNPIVMRVVLPLFVRKADDPEGLRRALLEVTRMMAMLMLPVLTALALTAPYLIPAVFGEEWRDSVILVQILAAVGAGRAILNPLSAVVLARDRTDAAFLQSVATAVLIGVAFVLVVDRGVEAVAWAWLGVSLLLAFGTWLILTRVVGMRGRRYVATMTVPAALTVPMAAAIVAIAFLLDEAGAADAVVLAAQIVVGAVVYLGLALLLQREYLRSMLDMVRGRSAPAPSAVGT